jgi:2-polyprenyl-6-methoxyphenol hydroxylase-like FAD-dependent oxidoreductase
MSQSMRDPGTTPVAAHAGLPQGQSTAGWSVLISGIGIAGPALAYWLLRAGMKPTLIEHAPVLRRGGYVVDFWGLGYDVAERMGLADALADVGYRTVEMRIVGKRGERLTGFGINVFRELTGGRFVTVRRSDLAALLFAKVKEDCETIFGDEIISLVEDARGVEARFRHAGARRFDLVVGADGLRSKIRDLIFGNSDRFVVPLGYGVAAFETQGYRPRDEHSFVIHNEPGLMLARYALRDNRTLFLFVFATGTAESLPIGDIAAQKVLLAERYGTMSWEGPRVLSALQAAGELYFDQVSQIHMDGWSKGRVVLVGDAAFCPSLLAGQGCALAMTAAYVLAGELSRSGAEYASAFSRYEVLLRPFLAAKQRGARNFGGAFAPRTRLGVLLRNAVIGAAAVPGVARLVLGWSITDQLTLPEYRWP